MNRSSELEAVPNEYIYRLDKSIPERLFADELQVTGWLLRADGEAINGIRALVKRSLFRPEVVRARRKRSRPDVAAAFPDLPEAKASGFLLEIPLSLGRYRLQLQVRDPAGDWHTFHQARVSALPLTWLARLRLPRVRQVLLHLLAHSPLAYDRHQAPRSIQGPRCRPVSQSQVVRRVELYGTRRSNLFILEIAELIAAGFRELGLSAALYLDQFPKKEPQHDTLQVIVTPHEFYNLYLSELVSREEARALTRETILLCTEQPETGWFQSNLQWAPFARAVADINPLGVCAYDSLGLRSHYLPLGFHPMLCNGRARPITSRNTDITFLGSLTERREVFFAEHAEFFAEHRCHLRFVPLHFAKTELSRSYLSPERRNDLLSKTKILLNIHYSERRYFEWHRMLLGLANGCCLITETSEGYGPLVPGEHFIMVEREDLIAACEYYLHQPNECKRVAESGYEFVQQHLRQAQMCEAFLQQLQTNEYSMPADERAVSLPRDLEQGFANSKRKAFKQALAADLRQLFKPEKALSVSSAPPPADLLLARRSQAIDRRAAIGARFEEQEARRLAGEEVWTISDNGAYRLVEPVLSVVITLFNYAQFIHECLDSVEVAATQLRGDLEIVIVDDASTDESLAQATYWQTHSSLAVRVIAKRFNTGLADARNTGVHFARGPLVFMMDADNLVYPAALRELYNAICSGDRAAAYSILCRFQKSAANRVGLLSSYDFDPQILVQQPYVDAMALFRRDVLLELSGYDHQLSQIGWFGWEDYELWLRFATRDLPVAFVPNVLCLYRQHETSMLSVTNLFELDFVRHFQDRFGTLSDRFPPEATLFGVRRELIEVAD